MSLVVCFSGKKGAIIAGDMREILFGGDDDAIGSLEKELYSGIIKTGSTKHYCTSRKNR